MFSSHYTLTPFVSGMTRIDLPHKVAINSRAVDIQKFLPPHPPLGLCWEMASLKEKPKYALYPSQLCGQGCGGILWKIERGGAWAAMFNKYGPEGAFRFTNVWFLTCTSTGLSSTRNHVTGVVTSCFSVLSFGVTKNCLGVLVGYFNPHLLSIL